MKAIPFFDQNITINPHSGTHADDLHEQTIADFAQGEPCAVYATADNELLIKRGTRGTYQRAFIQGEVTA